MSARTLSNTLFEASRACDDEEWIVDDARHALRRSRLLRAVFPERVGGSGLLQDNRVDDLVSVLRLIGAGDLSVGRIFEGHVNAVALVERYGTGPQLAELAAAVAGGEMSGVWNAEGSRPLSAQLVDGSWHLQGGRILASGAGVITRPIVTPLTPEGVIMLIPTLGSDERVDLSAWTPQGMRASATGSVEFSGLEAPMAAQIGEPGDYLRQPVFSGGAWRFCAVHLGAAERLLDLFRAHLVARKRHDDPYQKQRIAHCVAATTTAALWIGRAAALAVSETLEAEEIVGFVNMTRMVTERACLDVLEAVHRGIGLGAFMRPDPVERISRDLATYLRQPVPDAAMADAARMVLASKKSAFDLWGA